MPEFDGRGLLPRRAGLAAGRGGHSTGRSCSSTRGRRTRRRDFLAPFPERTEGLGIALRFAGRKTYELDCNWKVFVDNYQDGGYHVNTVHPGLAEVLDYAHYRTENSPLASVQSSLIKPSDDPTVKQVRAGYAYYCGIFPNLMINLYQGVMDTNLGAAARPGPLPRLFRLLLRRRGQLRRPGVQREQYRGRPPGAARGHGGLRRSAARAEEPFVRHGTLQRRRESGGHHFHQILARYLCARPRPFSRRAYSPRGIAANGAMSLPCKRLPAVGRAANGVTGW